jgi:hypothetical protein
MCAWSEKPAATAACAKVECLSLDCRTAKTLFQRTCSRSRSPVSAPVRRDSRSSDRSTLSASAASGSFVGSFNADRVARTRGSMRECPPSCAPRRWASSSANSGVSCGRSTLKVRHTSKIRCAFDPESANAGTCVRHGRFRLPGAKNSASDHATAPVSCTTPGGTTRTRTPTRGESWDSLLVNHTGASSPTWSFQA